MLRLIDIACVVLLAATAAACGGVAASLGGGTAMAAGMVIGMGVAMAGALLLTPVAGMFEVMIPGTWAGMAAGMAGAMVYGHLPVAGVAGDGALLGLAVALYFQALDRRLRGVQG